MNFNLRNVDRVSSGSLLEVLIIVADSPRLKISVFFCGISSDQSLIRFS